MKTIVIALLSFLIITQNNQGQCPCTCSPTPTVTPTPSASPTNNFLTNLYAYYKMDESVGNALDASINSRNLGQSANILTGAGVINSARLLPGGYGGPYFGDFGHNTTFQPGANPFFVTIWVKNVGTFGYDAGLAGKFVVPNASWLLYRKGDTHEIDLGVTTNGTTGTTVVGTAINDSNWHFIGAGWDGTNLKVSVDGGAFATAAFAGPIYSSNVGVFQIGAEAASNTWPGLIDEVGIWIGRSMSLTEVQQIYNGGAGLPFSSFK